MNQPPVEGWIKTTSEEEVIVPAHGTEGYKIATKITVPAWKDSKGEIFLSDEAIRKLDEAKARYMGLVCPEQLKQLRKRHNLNQKQISQLLQIGSRTWTRWERGNELPSRSMNILLKALYDNTISIRYLEYQQNPTSTFAADDWIMPRNLTNQAYRKREFTQFSTSVTKKKERYDLSTEPAEAA